MFSIIVGGDQLSAMYHMIKERKGFDLRMLHLILHGTSSVGKTCVKLKLTNQKLNQNPAMIVNGKLTYPDGARSTLVAEEILRARVPFTALGAMDKPWQKLNFDEEKFSMAKKVSNSAKEHTSSVEQQPTGMMQVPRASDDDEAFQQLKQLLPEKIESIDIQDIRDGTLMYLIDSGGQPQFHQFLPSLVSGPSLFLLTFSLAVDLHEPYEVKYTHSSGERYQYKTTTTVYNVLQQSLASIRCTCSHQTNGHQTVEVQPRVILVGTMKSLVNPDKIATINQDLMPLRKEFGTNLIVPIGCEEVVFPIDSFTDDNTIMELRRLIQDVADEKVKKCEDGNSYESPMCEVKLPVPTVALELLLRSRDEKIIELKDCQKLAAGFNILSVEELKSILWQLHHFTGSIRYYPNDDILEQYVVISPKLLYDIPSFLITRTFGFGKAPVFHYDDKEEMQNRGVFKMKTLRKLWTEQEDYGPLLTPELLVAFLLHLNIIAELDWWSVGNAMEQDTERVTEEDRRKFFMPSAIVHCNSSSNEDDPIEDDSALICFKGGYTPNGVFSSVLAYLLNKKQLEGYSWILDEQSLRSNQATLLVTPDNVTRYDLLVTLRVHLKYLEVKIGKVSRSGSQDPSHDDCTTILRCIQDTVQKVKSGLHYNHEADPKQELFFPCRCHRDESIHAVEYKEDGNTRCKNYIKEPDESWKRKWTKGS